MMSDETHMTSSGSYQIELLKGVSNWVPLKRRMLAILRDLGLEQYVTGEAEKPTPSNTNVLTADEAAAMTKWTTGDVKARMHIELAVGDSEMIHLSGAKMAHEMWTQLTLVYENTSRIELMVAMHTFYGLQAKENDTPTLEVKAIDLPG